MSETNGNGLSNRELMLEMREDLRELRDEVAALKSANYLTIPMALKFLAGFITLQLGIIGFVMNL